MLYVKLLERQFARVGAVCERGRLFYTAPAGCSVISSAENFSDTDIGRNNFPSLNFKSETPVVRQRNVPYYGTGVTRQPVPLSASTVSWTAPLQPDDAHIVKVALVGLPNAGKSSLMNALIKSPIAAVSPKVNTTREDIKGIMCVDNCQMVFTDCPGILESHRRRKFCGQLVSTAWKAYDESDVCLFIVDAVKRPDASLFKVIRSLAGAPLFSPDNSGYIGGVGPCAVPDALEEDIETRDIEEPQPIYTESYEEEGVYTSATERKKPVGLVLNKIDLAEHRKWVKSRTRELKNHGKFDDIFYTSAKHGIGFNPIIQFLKSKAKPGMWVYPPDMLTTMSKVQVVEQMVRTYIYCWFNKELPYRVGQKVIGWTTAENGSLIIEMVSVTCSNSPGPGTICQK